MAQVVENLPSKHKTLNSLPISAKKEGREEERKEGRKVRLCFRHLWKSSVPSGKSMVSEPVLY
jgi:hypothetical protein